MKYTETGFRPLYHKYCIFPLSETIRDVLKNIQDMTMRMAY